MNIRPAPVLAIVTLLTLALYSRRASASFLPSSFLPALPFMPNSLASYIERHEGRVAYVYRDSAGIETFGVGHKLTAADGYLRQYTKANPAPASVIDGLFARDVAAAVSAVDGLGVKLTANQRTAFVSLAFNIGAGAFRSSTAARLAKAGDMRGAADAIALFNKATVNGKLTVVAGLASRRADERALFLA
ncbi:lysozyme [Nevskia ramosa]|uniref:lysozyme n=1 Tax=Nevskia ramosa TaxID=64002 RepID=UPI0003B76AC3|nr:lysozyme [Nevskia ramosa]